MRLLVSRLQVRISDVTEFLQIRGLFLIFLIAPHRAAFCRVLASVYELKLRFCVKRRENLLSNSKSVKVTKNGIGFLFRKWNLIFRFLSEIKILLIDPDCSNKRYLSKKCNDFFVCDTVDAVYDTMSVVQSLI